MRASLVLGVIAAGLLAFILVFERGSLSSRELEQRKGSVLPELQRDRVAKIEIQRKGVMTVLERDLSTDDEGGIWKVTTPYRSDADPEAVETLVSELEWLHGQRSLGSISAQDRKSFGLEAPRFRLWFTVGSARVPVLVGNPSADGKGVYVGAGDPVRAFVVGKDFAESLSHEPEHFHAKTFHEGVMMMTTRAVSFTDAAGTRAARLKDHGFFELEAPHAGLASEPSIKSVIDAADSLRASRYVAETVTAKHGLSPAKRELRVYKRERVESASAKDKPKPATEDAKDEWREVLELHLRIGAACDGHEAESYVTASDKGPLYCALDADLEKLFQPLEALQETRLLPIEDDEVTAISVEQSGTKLAITKADTSFEYTRTGSGAAQKGTAREGAVPDWLAALRATTVRPAASPSASEQPARSHPWSLRVVRGKSQQPFVVEVVRVSPDEIEARRSHESGSVLLDSAAAGVLDASASRLRPLALRSLKETSVLGLQVERGTQTERLERKAGTERFEVVQPVRAPADPALASDLVRLLAQLEAVRFAADDVRAEHGLAVPSQVATLDLAPEGGAAASKLVLRVGAPTSGGRFAQLAGDAAVFVISDQLADLLARPLVARDILATPIDRIAKLELRYARRSTILERGLNGLEARPPSKLDAATAQQLAELVATLRVESSLEYARMELREPTLYIGVETTDGARYAISVGDSLPEGGFAAWREKLPVALQLSEATVNGFIASLSGAR